MMNHVIEYDRYDALSIETYAKRLEGKTFSDVCYEDDIKKYNKIREGSNYEAKHADKRRKGGLGELIEERYFHYKANNDSEPDFKEAGVELKVTPYKLNKNGTIVAKERLIITMIDYFKVINEPFEQSHLWAKSRLILLIYYLYQKDILNRLDYKIGYVKLFSPPEQDIKIIKHDFEVIVEKIRAGKAHELSEGDTLYLGAAPKAATSADRRKQPYSNELAKPRAFAFKNSYMTYVLNNYIISGDSTYESIINEDSIDSFEDYVVDKIGVFQDYTVTDICKHYKLEYVKKPKNLEAILAYKMLGINGNKAQEFQKANIVVKVIRIEKNKRIKESMSFPSFKFKELINEDWETSTFKTYLSNTRFFFVIYRYDENDELRLRGSQFWNMPYQDLENHVHVVWEKTKQVLLDGLVIKRKNGKNNDNFPSASEDIVCHVRPHARNSNDTYELPDGRLYPKQCFWLNNKYILSQLNKEFLD